MAAHIFERKDPVTDVRDWEGLVITGLVAARLHGVTDEHDLLILVHLLTHYAYDEDTENHHHCQQDPAERQKEKEKGRKGRGEKDTGNVS